jgi:hypothetical protein
MPEANSAERKGAKGAKEFWLGHETVAAPRPALRASVSIERFSFAFMARLR